MFFYCLKYREKADSKKLEVVKMKKWKNNGFIKLFGCNNKKSRFIKEQEASGLLSSLEIKSLSSQISLVGTYLF